MISYYGAGNITIDTASWGAYGSNVNDITPLEIRSSPDWNPADNEYRFIEIKNIAISLPSNPYRDRFTQIYIDYSTDGYTRMVDINQYSSLNPFHILDAISSGPEVCSIFWSFFW